MTTRMGTVESKLDTVIGTMHGYASGELRPAGNFENTNTERRALRVQRQILNNRVDAINRGAAEEVMQHAQENPESSAALKLKYEHMKKLEAQAEKDAKEAKKQADREAAQQQKCMQEFARRQQLFVDAVQKLEQECAEATPGPSADLCKQQLEDLKHMQAQLPDDTAPMPAKIASLKCAFIMRSGARQGHACGRLMCGAHKFKVWA